MKTGKTETSGIAHYPGNPTGLSTRIFNVEKGTLVIDSATPATYQKTTPLGDNSGYAVSSTGGNSLTHLADMATGGSGTAGDPWTGWDGAMVKASNSTYYFRKGYYSAASLIFEATALVPMSGITLDCEEGTVLKLSGSVAASGSNGLSGAPIFPAGTALAFGSAVRPAQGSYAGIPQRISIRGRLVIDGAGSARVGLLWLHAWNIDTSNVSTRNLASGPAVTGVGVSSGANPTFTKTAHGFPLGLAIKASGFATGCAEANGIWVIQSVPDANTFTVGACLTTTGAAGTGGTVRAASIGMDLQWAIIGTHTNFAAATDIDDGTPPDIGLLARSDIQSGSADQTAAATGYYSTVNVFNAARLEGCVSGVVIDAAANFVFNAGTSEFCTSWGVKVLNRAFAHIFNSFDVEANGTDLAGTASVASGTNPAITLANHGLVVGQFHHIHGMSGAGSTTINDIVWKVTVVDDANTFHVGTGLVTTGAGSGATVTKDGDIYSMPGLFSSGNGFVNCVAANNYWDVSSSDYELTNGTLRCANRLILQAAQGANIELSIKNSPTAEKVTVGNFANGCFIDLPKTGDSFYGFTGDISGLTYSFASGDWLYSALPAGVNDIAGDYNLMCPASQSLNFGIHTTLMARVTAATWDFYTPLRPARITTTQRDAISSPSAGMVIYNTSTNKLNVYTTAWEAVTSL